MLSYPHLTPPPSDYTYRVIWYGTPWPQKGRKYLLCFSLYPCWKFFVPFGKSLSVASDRNDVQKPKKSHYACLRPLLIVAPLDALKRKNGWSDLPNHLQRVIRPNLDPYHNQIWLFCLGVLPTRLGFRVFPRRNRVKRRSVSSKGFSLSLSKCLITDAKDKNTFFFTVPWASVSKATSVFQLKES